MKLKLIWSELNNTLCFVKKKRGSELMSITLSNLNRFSNFFSLLDSACCGSCVQSVIMWVAGCWVNLLSLFL